LAYYPPYPSKYNPIERVWGVLENHWCGELLDSREKVLGLAESMTWRGCCPTVTMLSGSYEKGKKLNALEMARYESLIERLPGLEPWFVDIKV
jgi:Rhodopirellula transposase DDE domain